MGADLEGLDSLLETTEDIADDWGDSGPVVYIVGTNVEYAPYVEFGTAPHQITPSGDGPLRFQVDGEWVSTYVVEHPGTDPQPFLRPALDDAERNLRKLAEKSDSLLGFVQRVALFVERRAKQRAPVDTTNLRDSIRTERVE